MKLIVLKSVTKVILKIRISYFFQETLLLFVEQHIVRFCSMFAYLLADTKSDMNYAMEKFYNLVNSSPFYSRLKDPHTITATEQYLPSPNHPFYKDIESAKIAKNKTKTPTFYYMNYYRKIHANLQCHCVNWETRLQKRRQLGLLLCWGPLDVPRLELLMKSCQ